MAEIADELRAKLRDEWLRKATSSFTCQECGIQANFIDEIIDALDALDAKDKRIAELEAALDGALDTILEHTLADSRPVTEEDQPAIDAFDRAVEEGRARLASASSIRKIEMGDLLTLPYVYAWDRQGRKGQPCAVTARSKAMNSCRVEFADGYIMITSRNALRKRKPAEGEANG